MDRWGVVRAGAPTADLWGGQIKGAVAALLAFAAVRPALASLIETTAANFRLPPGGSPSPRLEQITNDDTVCSLTSTSQRCVRLRSSPSSRWPSPPRPLSSRATPSPSRTWSSSRPAPSMASSRASTTAATASTHSQPQAAPAFAQTRCGSEHASARAQAHARSGELPGVYHIRFGAVWDGGVGGARGRDSVVPTGQVHDDALS